VPESPRGRRYDVAIVGAGPTGLTLAILLAQQGHQVAVVERHPAPYPLPRAVVFDSEAARGLAACGISGRFGEFSEAGDDYVWLDASGELLLRFPMARPGASGWADANMMTQPVLESVLGERAAELPRLHLHRELEAAQAIDRGDHVEVVAHGPTRKDKSIAARYVVGCDGASSFVRERMNTSVSDLGFFSDWLIVDVVLDDASPWLPMNRQVCDPARPTTMVSGGPGKRRWEFMRMPADGGDFNSDENAWWLLGRWGVTPRNAHLEKRALYTFQARWADRWRDGRLLIAGDAAHLMPPFAGMGMCSGIRDSVNLAWKLDLVLRGVCGEELLDSYSTERSAHVRNAIFLSVELGKVICETDPAKVAARDAHFKGAGARPDLALPPIPPAALGPGVVFCGGSGDRAAALAGQLAPQPWLRRPDGRDGRADELVGPGTRLFIDAETAGTRTVLRPEHEDFLKSVGADVIWLTDGPATAEAFAETTAALLPAMREAGYQACLVRPDFYFFGGTALADLDTLIGDFATRLSYVTGSRREASTADV
jgi:2-polyprenyl-6-methoxyphenol hydroxylase-like FAD-dependent oxidoreductase